MLSGIIGETRSIVFHGEYDPAMVVPGKDPQVTVTSRAISKTLDRVQEQVEQYLLHLNPIDGQHRQLVTDGDMALDVMPFDLGTRDCDTVPDDVAD